jgi:hypothetical protein
MTQELESLDATQLDHVTGGMDIGGMIGNFTGMLEKFGVKGAAQAGQAIAPIVQQIAGIAQSAGGGQAA